MVDRITNNVGIGTVSPSQQLEITGDFEMPNTTFADQSGIIYKGANSFIHNFNYGNNGTVTTLGYNTFVGENAGSFTMGSTATETYHSSRNTAVGYQSLLANTTGYYNTASGYQSLRLNTAGGYNTANGMQSLYSNTTGNYNAANGANSLYLNATGSNNTAKGQASLYANTTASSNVAEGYNAGRYITDGVTGNTTGDYNIFIGRDTKALADDDQNEIVIGYNATGVGSNSVVLGNDSIVTTVLKWNVGIGTTSPFAKLSVVGDVVADYFNTTSTTATSTFAGGLTVGTNKLVVDRSTGNVGIGTVSPQTALEFGVVGNPHFIGWGAAYKWGMSSSNIVNFSLGSSYPSGFNLSTAASSGLFIDNSGNVGIGTTSPTALLHLEGLNKELLIDGLSGTATIAIQAGNSDDAKLSFRIDDGTERSFIKNDTDENLVISSVNTTDDIIFSSGTELMRVLGTGNVGIGTTSPFAKLSVKGAGTTTGINFQTTNSNDTPLVTVLDSGNVGIGTASPTAKLEVAGNGENFQILPGYGVSGDAVGTWLMTKASSWTLAPSADGVAGKKVVGVAYNGSTWHSMFEYANVGSGEPNLLLVKSGGNVGIGTTTPWRTLSVNGTAAFTGLTNNGTGYYACVSTSGELATSTTACGASS